MNLLLYAAVMVAGALNSVQAGTNAALNKALGSPYIAGLVVLGVSAVCFIAVGAVAGRLALPGAAQIASAPWWAWLGGIFGTIVLLAQFLVAHRIGAAPFMGLIVTSSVLASLALDHFGLVGFETHPIGAGRIIGAVLMIAGIGLIALF